MHGQFIWYELTTPDPKGAKDFYPRFTRWGTQPFDNDYTMWTTGGQPFGGIFQLTDEMRAQGVPPNWMPYVEVADVDDTGALATSLGGKVVFGPQDIPNVGRFAVIQDPQGAVLAVYKAATPARAWDGTLEVGRMSWHEMMTRDHVKAFEYYRRLFGWDKIGEMDMGGGQMYLTFGKGTAMYGGMCTMTDEWKAMHPFWLCYIHVKDVPQAVAIATKAGATLHRGPMDIPGGVIAILGDPQGAGFAVHHANAVTEATGKRPEVSGKKSVRGTAAAAKRAAKKKAAKERAAKRAPTKRAAKKAPRKRATQKAPRKRATRRTARRRPVRRRATRKRSRR
jgi:hypothetical protein